MDRLAALARKRARMWNMIKRAGDRLEMDVSCSTPTDSSVSWTKTFGQTFAHPRPSSRFRPASMIVIIDVSPRVNTENTETNEWQWMKGRVEKGGRPDDVLAWRKNPLTRSEFRLKMDARGWRIVANDRHVLCSFIYLLTCERMSWLNRSVFVTREHLHLRLLLLHRQGIRWLNGGHAIFTALGDVGDHLE